jgi:hypothetical protein
LAALICFVAAAAAGWGLAGLGRGKAVPLETAAPQTVVRVEADPANAEIWVEGALLGRAPLTLEAPRGSELRVEARRGPLRGERRCTLSGSRETLVIALLPIRPAADGGPQPSGANSGRRPDAGLLTDARLATVGRPDAEARRSARGSATVRKGKGAKLSRASGSLTVVVVPWAKVTLDGAPLGQTPVRGHTVGAGRHTLELHNSELGKSERIPITILPGGELAIRRAWGE